MATLAPSTRTTRIVLASASAGPFLVGFRLFEADSLSVLVNDLPRTDWTLASAFLNGYDDNASITFTADLATADVVQIDGSLVPRRGEDYLPSDPGLVRKMNIELPRIWASLQELTREVGRSVRSTSGLAAFVPKAGRAIIFDNDLNPTSGPTADEIANAQANAEIATTKATEAAVSAAEAELFDGPKVDLYSQIADVTSSQVPVGGYLRVVDRMLTLQRAPDAATDHQLTGAGAVKFYLIGPWSSSAFASSAAFIAAVAAYAPTLVANKTLLTVTAGESVAIPCNPTDHDFRAYANYAAAGHTVANTGELYLSVADGLHNVTTYVDITDRRFLDIRSATVPDQLIVTSATFAAVTGATVATINVDSTTPLPARVVAGFAVGGLNIQGDGGADFLNVGMIVKARISSTQFTADLRANGTDLAAFATPDNTASLGITPNRLLVPYCTIRADEAGWDGAAREAFINALRGGKVDLTYMGFSYNGLAGDNDMFFSQGAGSEVRFRDYCVVAGSGEMNLRSNDKGHIYANRSCFGGDLTGSNIWQGSDGGTLTVKRCMMGSVSGDAISTSNEAWAAMGLCVLTGANIGLRTTYASSKVTMTGSRVSRCNLAVAPTNGQITVDSNSSLKNSTTPISITGSNGGTAKGNPTIAGNTNAVVTSFAVQTSGGVWIPTASKTYDPANRIIGRFTGALDFPSIAANTYADLTIAATGAAFNDFVQFARTGSAEPAQGIVFRAFVSAADVVTVRAYNITTAAIDPTAFTGAILVARSS